MARIDTLLYNLACTLELRVEKFYSKPKSRIEQLLDKPQIENVVDYSKEEKIKLTAQSMGIAIPKTTKIKQFPKREPYKSISRNKKVVAKARKLLWEIKSCAYCGRVSNDSYLDPDNEIWHMDHVVPLSKGGNDSLENIVKSCANCNMKKGIKIIAPLQGSITANQIKQQGDGND